MRLIGRFAVHSGRFKHTTRSSHSLPARMNRLLRELRTERRDRDRLGDITYVQIEAGWLYLAALMALYSRRIVGRKTAARIDRCLTPAALEGALRSRRPRPGLIHHPDQGSRHTS